MSRPHANIRRQIKKEVFERDGRRCFWCEAALTLESATMDHIITKGRGGAYHAGNFVLSCFECNQARGDRDAAVFLHEQKSRSKAA